MPCNGSLKRFGPRFTAEAAPASSFTAANLNTTLTASVAKLADTSLTAASALAAANDFFRSP